MATGRPDSSAGVILLYLSALYSLFYFPSSLFMIVYKSQTLTYPGGCLALDVCLLLLMAAFEILRICWGVRGNLLESGRYLGSGLAVTGAALLLSVYFMAWQSYVLRADVVINAVLLGVYGVCGVAGFWVLARIASIYS